MGTSLRVLVVEDNDDDYQVLRRALAEAYALTIERVETAKAMTKALDERPWDIVISDWCLPRFSGARAIQLLKDKGVDLPLIVVSGTAGEETAIEALRSGANDFMAKGNLTRLVPAISRELRDYAVRTEAAKLHEQLVVSERMASVGILAAGVAHEINNPLSSVLANLQLAYEAFERLPTTDVADHELAEIREELVDARESAQRIREIVRDLKIFSRSGDDEEHGPVDVQRVLDSSLRMAWTEIRHRAQLVKEYAPVPLVHANEGRLGQVFLNLVVNAAQAIPEGRANANRITVRTRASPQGAVVVEIADTGSGIPPEVLKRLFTPFVTTKPVGVGTGLGLSICHRIVTGLGGDISVDTRLGKGTTFCVQLPPAQTIVAPVATSQAPISHAARRGRVLAVDDEPLIANAIRRSLENDHDVVVVYHASEAIDMVRGGARFDVIICDLMMPELTGMDLHEQLSEIAPDEAAKVIFLTGGAFTSRARAFIDATPNLHIEKPFDPAALRGIVNARVR